jgi:hypothetical protein
MKGILRRFLTRQRPSTEMRASIDEASTGMAALIARRAQRTANRRADVAARYEAKHMILAQGKRNG